MQSKKAYFIGICGKGMSATALLLKELGWEVSGSDDGFYPPVSTYLTEHKIPFIKGYAKNNIPGDADLIVIGKNAKLVPETNEEVQAAFESGKTIRSFPEVIEELVSDTRNLVISGSWGKSTATALLAWCLREVGKDPSYLIGEVTRGFDAHSHIGKGNTFVLEGDEYPSSNWDPTSKFLYYNPHDVLLTSAAHDHVNIFKTQDDFLIPFKTLLSLIPEDGLLVACADEPHALKLAQKYKGATVTYSLGGRTAKWDAQNISYGAETTFDLVSDGKKIISLSTTLLGKHNIQNIVGVSALLLETKLLTPEELAHGIASFQGVERRLILLSPRSSIRVYEGFGSSYQKARAAIDAMGLHFPNQRLIIVFEPHTFSWRNRDMSHWYDDVFDSAARVLVYEPATQGADTHAQLSQEKIVVRIKASGMSAEAIHSNDNGIALIEKIVQPDDIILLLTSGDLGGLIESIPKLVEEKFPKK